MLILNSFMLVIFSPAGIWDFWRLESCFIFIYNSQWVAKYWVINPSDCLMSKFIVAAFKLLGTFLMLLILPEPHGFPLGNFKSQSCSAISRTRVPSSDAYIVHADSWWKRAGCKNSGIGGSEGNRSESVLSRGIGTMPFQLTVACKNWSPHILPW